MKKLYQAGSVFENIPESHETEDFKEIYSGNNFLIERIVSFCNSTEWLVQDWDEWVYLCKGKACLELEGETEPVLLSAGSYLLIKSNCRHRVLWTESGSETVWIAIHIDSALKRAFE